MAGTFFDAVVYVREFLFFKQMAHSGALGKIQFVQASHQLDMDGWPEYWPGLPPMHHATHCVGPCLALERRDAAEVRCFGPDIPRRVSVPDFADRLPEPIRPFTACGVFDPDEHQHLSFTQGGGHGGAIRKLPEWTFS